MRVAKEAEYILEHERGRLVPMKQAPFAKFYTEDERAALWGDSTAVGDLFPNSFYAPRKELPAPQQPKKEINAMTIPVIIKKIDVFTNPVSPRKSK